MKTKSQLINLTFILLIIQLISCSIKKKDCKQNAIINGKTTFPKESSSPDYNVSNFQVKTCFPVDSEKSRIWVKGSSEHVFVQVFSEAGDELSKVYNLTEPFYTKIISVDSTIKKAIVKFSNIRADISTSENVKFVYPKNTNYFNRDEDRFSILFYGCFQPFRVKNKKSEVLYKGRQLNYLIRKSFDLIAQEKSFSSTYFTSPKKSYKIESSLIKNPKIIIGTGDQIYTDAGYGDKKLEGHPLSAWSHSCEDPLPLLDTTSYKKHLNNCYKHFNSFQCFENSFSKLPSLSVWDDHEIRDGWGSHGDEYEDSQISDFLSSYYYNSRKAYKDHQFSVGPNKNQFPYKENSSLHQITSINGVEIFAFDLRSNRNLNDTLNPVISKFQMSEFKEWCASVSDTSKEVIIVSSIPLFYESNKFSLWAAKSLSKEITDDIADSWSFKTNEKQKNMIISELIKLRDRNIKPVIISGDVHIGGMISVWYKSKKDDVLNNKRLCYEFIFSGLSHEKLGEARSDFTSGFLQHRAELPRVNDPTISIRETSIYPIYEFTRGRLNFGGIEFFKNKPTVASLFIIGDNRNSLIEEELELNWNETYSAYGKRCTGYKIWGEKGAFNPAVLPYNSVLFNEIRTEN